MAECVGAGAAGLVASGILGASQARVALIEANALGGDCTHVGCPIQGSPARLLSQVAAARRAIDSGWLDGRVEADGRAALRWPEGSYQRRRGATEWSAEELGADVFSGARSSRPTGYVCRRGGESSPVVELEFDRLILANGSTPLMPPIEGLDQVDASPTKRCSTRSATTLDGDHRGGSDRQRFARRSVASGVEIITIVEASGPHPPRDDPRAGEVVAGVLTREGSVNLLTDVPLIGSSRPLPESRCAPVIPRSKRSAGFSWRWVGLLLPIPGTPHWGSRSTRSGFPIVDAHYLRTHPTFTRLATWRCGAAFTHMAA
ncbi:MAG: FAD-dependent oxidoreductase [Microthrixaceae bacterium]